MMMRQSIPMTRKFLLLGSVGIDLEDWILGNGRRGQVAKAQLMIARFNIIWTDPFPYSTIVSMTSEDCPGLDD